ncbi:MAG: tetratricopeptide repeat protein [Burkholderiales bacterium]
MNSTSDIDKLCQKAWQLYEQGELDKAIATARDAMQQAQHPLQMLNCCAALGWFLIEKGDLAAAEDVLVPALTRAPEHAVLQWRMGVLQHRKGNHNQATPHLERALAIDPSLDEAASSLSWLLHDQSRPLEAITWVQHALALRETPERQAQLGWFLLLEGKATEAIPLFQKSIETSPQIESTHVHLARALNDVHKTEQARQVLEGALARFPNSQALLLAAGWPDIDNIHQKAWQLYEQGELDKAIATARDAMQQAQHPLQMLNCCAALGWFLIEKGDLAAAEDVLVPALTRAPEHAVLQWRMGVLQHRKGNHNQATPHLERALAIDPSLDEAASSLSWLLHDQSRPLEAITWVQHALALRETPERQAQLGWFLLLEGKATEAIPLFQKSIETSPQIESTHVHLARALNDVHKTEQARQVLEGALARFPNSQALLLAAGWQYRNAQEFSKVKVTAEQVIKLQSNCSNAWLLLGLAEQGLDKTEIAARHFRHAMQLDPFAVHAAISLANHLRHQRCFAEAESVISDSLHHQWGHPALCELQAQLSLDIGDVASARRHIHHLIANDRTNARLWHLLAQTLQKRHRIKLATVAVRRALQFQPNSAEAWILAAWLGVESGCFDEAHRALNQLLRRCPEWPDLDICVASILTACGDLAGATMRAETALARDPQSAQAMHVLGHVRHRQGRLNEAERLTKCALAYGTEFAKPLFRQLGWILRARGQLHDSASAFQQACQLDFRDPICICECAETQALAGDVAQALLTLQRARELDSSEPKVQLLYAQLLRDSGPTCWNEAVSVCANLLRKHTVGNDAAHVLLAIAAAGNARAQQALLLVKRSMRLTFYRTCLEATQARGSNAEYLALSTMAMRDFPEDLLVRTAALCAEGLSDMTPAPELARQTRGWSRELALRSGTYQYSAHLPSSLDAGRLRIAYVAAHFHRSLLVRVLASHNFDTVDVFLYCDIPIQSLGELAARVHLQALRGQDLAASMHANQIDVAIDTVGVDPFIGQDAVLLQFSRRLAPVQCAWLGSWSSSGGVFDYLLSDCHAAPKPSDGSYDEYIARIPGGQWCWDPPVGAPAVSPPPQLTSNIVSLGCAVRSFRLSPRVIHVWVRLLVRLPNAQLVLMGEHGQNAQFRAELFAALTGAGIELGRVVFQVQCAYHDYLASYNAIDIALDSFPANGGLCLLDALWMGVPVVTLAGNLLGERQGLSILESIGHPEWIAMDEESYINTVCRLAGDPHALAGLRKSLRTEITRSPLHDGQRVAHAIEAHCQRWKREAEAIASATSPKERLRALAQRQLTTWLNKGSRLDLAQSNLGRPATIDISVVVVLFNQAGLARQALCALADQTGICFETIVVDNASGEDMRHLLDRMDGAHIVRNSSNVGFLQAANQGAALASGRHILFLNSDATLHPHALHKAAVRLDSDPRIGAVGGRIVLADGTLQEAGCIAYAGGSTAGYGRGQDPNLPEFNFVRAVDFCSGAFLMVRRSLWLDLGGFNLAFAPAYYEDSDFCMRIQDAGYSVIYDPGVWVSHFECGSAASSHDAIAMMESNCQRFYTRHQERLAHRPSPTHASPHLDRWRALRKNRILIIDNGVPHMAAGGGLPRARLVVQALSDNYVTLFPMWDIHEDWRDVYASVPETVEVMLGIGAAGLEAFLRARMGVYDFLMVSRHPNIALVDALRIKQPNLFDGMQVVYDAEALFALRDLGKAALSGSAIATETAQHMLQQELALTLRADAVISVSVSEAHIIRAAGVAHVHLLSHAMETRANTPDWSQREDLLFVGAVHPDTPNEDSLLWFCREVMPILRVQYGLNLSLDIVGDCSSGPVCALVNKHIRLLGRIDDLVPCYDQHRVFVAPTRFAAGVPAKVIEAACNGIPVVATTLLVNQLDWRAGHDILAADDPLAFAAAIAALYIDPAQWHQLRTAMLNRARLQYAPEQFQEILRNIFTR